MGRYIWITAGVIVLLLTLGLKQAPKEPAVQVPDENQPQLSGEGTPVASESGNLKVTAPQPGAKVASPLLVKGEARTPDATFQMQLKDDVGTVLAEKTVTYTAEEGSEFGSFGELLLYETPSSNTGTLSVFAGSAEDGSPQDRVEIPVTFE